MRRSFALLLVVFSALARVSPAAAADVWHDYLTVQSGQSDEAKGLDPSRSDYTIKVTNGTVVNWHEFRSLVRIIFKAANGRHEICSGVLVSDQQVLTAGHCACGADYVLQFIDNDELFGIAGYPRTFPGYYCASSPVAQAGRDLALLNVAGRLDQEIAPRVAHLFDLQLAEPIEKLAVVGFGLDENNVLPTEPKIGFVPVFSLYCSTGRAALSACQPFREFALSGARDTTTDQKVDTCGGDSGGPVFAFRRKRLSEKANDSSALMESILVGITSRPMAGVVHIAGTDHCGGGGIYSSVGRSDVLAWLSREGVYLRLVTSAELAPDANH
jgi:hypothetical protein